MEEGSWGQEAQGGKIQLELAELTMCLNQMCYRV